MILKELVSFARDRRHALAIALAVAASQLTYGQSKDQPIPIPEGSWKSAFAEVNGLRMHYVEQGSGPLVLLLHGFPELWYSWRHQMPALAQAGYRAVAPDLRGYGLTGGPKSASEYSIKTLVDDVAGLMDALGEKSAVLIGHDFGAVLTWNAALLLPERVRAIVAMSVPYNQRRDIPPVVGIRRAIGGNFNYIVYFQEPGVAEAELEADVERFLRTFYFHASAAAAPDRQRLVPRSSRAKLLETLVAPGDNRRWLPDQALRYYVDNFTRFGLTGPINWYRNLDRNWEQMKEFYGARITQPTLFIAGELDPVLNATKANLDAQSATVAGLRRTQLVPGCGHWVQQECPGAVNAELLAFLPTLTR
jgi:pimeloyl-ACP methyl ester carboxylesterase